jgi:hypothetical protein
LQDHAQDLARSCKILARILQDSWQNSCEILFEISCKKLAQILQDVSRTEYIFCPVHCGTSLLNNLLSCRKNLGKILARILQDLAQSCKILARFLQDSCKILEDLVQDLAKFLQDSCKNLAKIFGQSNYYIVIQDVRELF